jgi:hypothetical protein
MTVLAICSYRDGPPCWAASCGLAGGGANSVAPPCADRKLRRSVRQGVQVGLLFGCPLFFELGLEGVLALRGGLDRLERLDARGDEALRVQEGLVVVELAQVPLDPLELADGDLAALLLGRAAEHVLIGADPLLVHLVRELLGLVADEVANRVRVERVPLGSLRLVRGDFRLALLLEQAVKLIHPAGELLHVVAEGRTPIGDRGLGDRLGRGRLGGDRLGSGRARLLDERPLGRLEVNETAGESVHRSSLVSVSPSRARSGRSWPGGAGAECPCARGS